MYILHYRNPILVKSMKKVFWRFPSKFESNEKWDRLEPLVKKQVNWLYDPVKHDGAQFKHQNITKDKDIDRAKY